MEEGKKRKPPKIEITELFMAKKGKKGFSDCFYGTIIRLENEFGEKIVASKIKVNDGTIWSLSADQQTLGENLDMLVEMILDGGLHTDSGKRSEIAGSDYFHN